jgi:hypothetical protein
MTDRVVIVCRNSMLLGGRVSNSTRPLIWGDTRPTTASRRPAPVMAFGSILLTQTGSTALHLTVYRVRRSGAWRAKCAQGRRGS